MKAALFALPALMLPATAAHAAPKPAPRPALHAAPHGAPRPSAANWAARVTVSPTGGHVMGNPQAGQAVVEYMSYTCPHCAHFEAESALVLRNGPIASGKVSFEVRHLLRDPIDATIAALTNCVPPARFFALHDRFLAEQPKWFAIAQKMTEEQMKRWNDGPMPQRMRAIASDLHFYDTTASAGLSRAQTDGCFANAAILHRLSAQTKDATETLHINGTPGFTLNGQVLGDVHDWPSLAAALDSALAPAALAKPAGTQ